MSSVTKSSPLRCAVSRHPLSTDISGFRLSTPHPYLAFVNDILLRREFASDRRELQAIPQLLEAVRDRCALDDGQFFNLVIALTEAVNNAIVHGNRSNPSLTVRYSVTCREDGVHCVVEDQGEGFSIDDVADPTDPINILNDGGRGIFLIRALMRDVRVDRFAGGARVAFVCPRG